MVHKCISITIIVYIYTVTVAHAFNIVVFVGSVGFVRERGVVSEEIIKIYKRMNIFLNRCVRYII